MLLITRPSVVASFPLSSRCSRRWLHRKIAIVGSGPAGCYTAKYLQSTFDKQGLHDYSIDILERQATLGGLVRFGVAPDHPEVKNVLKDFEGLFSSPRFRFFGNVTLGRDVQVQELRQMYDVVVLAYGCESSRKTGLEGEDLQGVLSAREFVAWYNGHPDYLHIGDKVAEALASGCVDDKEAIRQASVVVLGHGNVAMDCARILAKGGRALFDTDLAAHALPVLGDGVKNVFILGRRGHIQAAFTIKEVRELINLEKEGCHAEFLVSEKELELGTTDASRSELAGPSGRPRQRIDKLLRDVAAANAQAAASRSQPKQVHLRFLVNPVRFEADSTDATRLRKVICERTRLEGEPGKQRAVGTGEYHEIPAQLALVSIGYRGVAVPGLEPWFDNQRGAVIHRNGCIDAPVPGQLGGLYASGWLKRGPSGIIGTNIPDAKETVASIVSSLVEDNAIDAKDSLGSLLSARGVQIVDWRGYRRIVEEEMAGRRSEHQPREKITDVNLLLKIASS